jgi:hypothetical protein
MKYNQVMSVLTDLELRRSELCKEIYTLGDFRAGSIGAIVRRCGKTGCRCSQPGDPGHGPNIRLTYKRNGKTYSESLNTELERNKAEREIAEFRKFQGLCRDLIDVNIEICRLRRPKSRDVARVVSGRAVKESLRVPGSEVKGRLKFRGTSQGKMPNA